MAVGILRLPQCSRYVQVTNLITAASSQMPAAPRTFASSSIVLIYRSKFRANDKLTQMYKKLRLLDVMSREIFFKYGELQCNSELINNPNIYMTQENFNFMANQSLVLI